MGRCANHPEKDTSYACLKHNLYMCEDCLRCRDPEIYCKHRTACPIHFLTRRKGRLEEGESSESETACGAGLMNFRP